MAARCARPVMANRKRERRRAVTLWLAGLLVIAAAAGSAAALGFPTLTVLSGSALVALVWLIVADRSFMRRPGGIPCLTWHSVSSDAAWLPWADAISMLPETLDRQLRLLGRMGCRPMDTVAFCEARAHGRPMPENAVLLHFDDGLLDNWVAAAPILQRHGMRATMFVSLDFIAPDRPAPQSLADTERPARWDGYLCWSEIAALDGGAFGGVFDIQAHGVDHGRVVTGPRIVDRLNASNWRRLAWMQWAASPGCKHDWYKSAAPPACPLGTPVPESGGALAARAWADGAVETEAAYEARVRRDLIACRTTFLDRLGKAPSIFCWPQNLTSSPARRVAAEEGFIASTAGPGTNRPSEPADIISRVHVGERVAGFRSALLDDLAFRATVRCFQGNHYWYVPILGINLVRAIHARLPHLSPRRAARLGART